MLLSEAASKIEHIAGVPLQPEVAAKLLELYLAKGALATTAIEGNTLSEDQVLKHMEGELKLPPSQQYLAQEVDNIIAACQWIAESAELDGKVTPRLIKTFNQRVLDGLPLEDPETRIGEFRTRSVVVGNVYRGAPAEDLDYLVSQLCGWLDSEDFVATQGLETIHAIVKAVLAHLHVAWIHPFGDGNGRTSRLLEFYLLLSAGIPQPATHLLSNHYNATRPQYYSELERASKSGGDILPFLEYAVSGLVEGLKGQLAYIRDQQWEVACRIMCMSNSGIEAVRHISGKETCFWNYRDIHFLQ